MPSQGLGDTTPNRPKRWGAFAGSESDGASGVGLDKRSRASAERAAMAQCRNAGGMNCEVFFVFLNQCGAVASTATNSTWARGPTLSDVRDQAMSGCKSRECSIIFEHCL
ncbi:DUF4189 domain-containing protein [Luteimonas deserti]|uniref:DUF4189 domain-containing protein n=1 Tax=Luteimonas deserti TaxID=2752306 RepID=UPI001C5CA029